MNKFYIYFAFILFLSPALTIAQYQNVNTDFEKANRTGKLFVKWNSVNGKSYLVIDSTTSSSGKNSVRVRTGESLRDIKDNDPATYFMVLPKSFYKGLRSIKISVDIRTPYLSPSAGLWCKVMKDKEYLGGASTLKDLIPFPISPRVFSGNNVPVNAGVWTPYSFDIDIDQDPTDVLIGLYVSTDRAWFDNIRININGNPLDNLIFKIKSDN